MSLRIYTLGCFSVYRGDESVTASAWKTQKNKTLLKILITCRQRTLTRDQILEWLWPELGLEAASRNLRVAVSQLREALEPDLPRGASSHFILTTDIGYAWNIRADYWLDANEFDRMTRSALLLGGALDTETLSYFRLVTNLYQGDYLEEDRYADWAIAERERLRETQLILLTRLAEANTLLRQYSEAVALCRRILAADRCRESIWRQLMLSHFYTGDQAAAIRAYNECRQVLQDEMDVEPMPETRGLYEQILRRTVPTPPSAIPHNLPRYLTPFVGRQTDLEEIARRLGDPTYQLVTLVGSGGIGKTRLAIQAALLNIERFPQGVYFVSLASVDSAASLVSAIANTLQLTFTNHADPRAWLLDYLSQKRLLLILDGFEHLSSETMLIVDLLHRAPHVHILVTSRQAVNLQAAWTIEISGLAYSGDEFRAGDTEAAYDAVQLFVERASRVGKDHLPELEKESPSIIQICRLVDGVPLGIELAAAWVNQFTCQQIAQAIARDLDFLATTMQDVPLQHRSLRTVFERSWNLLSADERLTFGRLSAFRGGFNRQAGARVTGASKSILSALVAKSLLRKSQTERYDMHELVCQYAAEKLAETPQDYAWVYDQHCAYYAEFMHERATALKGNRQLDALNEIRAEIDNVRLAWRWAIEHGKAAEIDQSLDCLCSFYESQGRFSEGLEAFETAANRWMGQGDHQELFGRLLARQGRFCERLGRYNQAQELGQASLVIATQLGMMNERTFSLYSLGNLAYQQGEFVEAKRAYQESFQIAEEIGDLQASTRALLGLGLVAEAQGEYAQAKQLFQKSLALSKQAADLIAAARSSNYLGLISCCLGEYTEAKEWCHSSLVLLREIGDRHAIALALDYLGHASMALGEFVEAGKLYQDSLAIRRETGNRWGVAASFDNLGAVAFALGEYAAALRWHQDSLAMSKESNFRGSIARSLFCLARVAYARGEYQEAQSLHLQSLHINQELGHTGGIARNLSKLGATMNRLGEAQVARSYLRQALELIRETEALSPTLDILVEAVGLLAQDGQATSAVELAAFILNLPAAQKETRDQAARILSELGTALSPEAFVTAQKKGKALTVESALEAVMNAW